MFLGLSFLSDNTSLSLNAVNESDINNVKLSNAIFDNLYVTSADVSSDTEIPTEWDFNTILKADFNGNVSAGNVDFTLNEVSGILIKHRIAGTFEWTEVFYKDINTLEDFDFVFYDNFCKSNKIYEFALVPVTNYIENNYNIQSIESLFDGIYLFDIDKNYNLPFNTKINTSKRNTNVKIEPIESKYPYTWNISKQRYDSGSLTTVLMPTKNGYIVNEHHAQEYRKEFIEFLCNGQPKILKLFDGRIWMIQVSEDVSESDLDHWNLKEESFNWYEIGDVNSAKDLAENGFTDVPEERW